MAVAVTTSTPRERRVRHIRAVRAGADRVAEVLAELGVVFADPRYRLAHRAGHTGSSAFGGGCGPPLATTQADRARELSDEEVTLGVGLRLPHVMLDGARLLDVTFDLDETAAIGVLGPLIEHLARVAERRLLSDLRGDQVQHVKLAARVAEELCEIAHALEVADVDRTPLEVHRPVVALAAEEVGVGRRARRDFDPLEDRPGSLQL